MMIDFIFEFLFVILYIHNWTGASIKLQALLNHTVQRLLKTLSFAEESPQRFSKLVFTVKSGCDGSSGHAEYKQTPVPIQSKTSDEDEEAPALPPSDSHLFLFSLQPLSLVGTEDVLGNETTHTVWQNRKPSSTKYCRLYNFFT
jgi:hypothetical protein